MKYVFLLMRDTMREEHGGTTKNKMSCMINKYFKENLELGKQKTVH